MWRGSMAEGLGRNCSAGTVLSGLYHQRRKRPRRNRTPSGAVQDYQEGRKDMKKAIARECIPSTILSANQKL